MTKNSMNIIYPKATSAILCFLVPCLLILCLLVFSQTACVDNKTSPQTSVTVNDKQDNELTESEQTDNNELPDKETESNKPQTKQASEPITNQVAQTDTKPTKPSATTITQNYLAHNSTAKYTQRQHLPYANPQAPKAGTLSLQASGTFNSANPWANTGVAMQGTNYLYDTLMTVSLDEAATMYPQLAEKVTFDPNDQSWIIYHLNPNAKFWDESTVTSADVKATFTALTKQGPMWTRNYLSDLQDMQLLDAQRIKFIFKTASNKDILLSVGQFPVFKQSSIAKYFTKVSLTPLVGSGAYQIDNINAGRSVTYKRNPNYWGRDLMVNRGRYNFDKIKYIYYMSDEIAFEGFKAGQYQFREETKARHWATAYDFPAVKSGNVVKELIDNKNPVAMQALVMNQRRDLFKNLYIRQALTHAFDFEWMNKTLFYGQYERLQSYFYNSELAATGTPRQQEMAVIEELKPLIDKQHYPAVISNWQLAKSDVKGFNRQALLQARELLLKAGCHYQEQKLYCPNTDYQHTKDSKDTKGGTDKKGNTDTKDSKQNANSQLAKFEILLPSGSPLPRVILPYMRNLQRLGFVVNVREVDSAQYMQRKRNYDFDMIFDVFMQGSSPGAEQASYWGSDAVQQIGNQNTAGISNPAIDALIEKLALAENRDDIITYSKVLDRLLRAGYYMVPMYGSSKKRVAYWQHYKHAQLPTHAIGIDYWWYE